MRLLCILNYLRRTKFKNMESRNYSRQRRNIFNEDIPSDVISDCASCFHPVGRNVEVSGRGFSKIVESQRSSLPIEPDADHCARKNCLSDFPLAMSYTPDQEWIYLYGEDDAMSHGTIFTELYKPFYHGCVGSKR